MDHEDLPDDGREKGKIRGCNHDLNEPRDPQELQESPHTRPLSRTTLTGNFVPPGTGPPHTCGSLPPSDSLCAEPPSFPESSKTTPAVPPTIFRAPTRLPRPRRRNVFRRSSETAFLSSSRRATGPATPLRGDPRAAPEPSRAAP